MKPRVIWLAAPAVMLALGACKKKEEVKPAEAAAPAAVEAPASAAPATEAPATPPPAPKPAALSPEERAAKLGFVRHLPQDTEVVMTFHNGAKTAERVSASKLWKAVQSGMMTGMMGPAMEMEEMEEMDEEADEDFALPEGEQEPAVEIVEVEEDADETPYSVGMPEMEEGGAEPMGPAKLFGTEFTIAVGKGTATQTGHLLTLNRRVSYFQMRGIAKAFVEAVKSGDFSALGDAYANSYGEALGKDLVNDPESGIALFEKMNMPPLYLAFRTSAADRESAAQQLAALTENLAMLGDVAEPVEVEKAGAKFAGRKINGTKVSAMMEEGRAEVDEMLGSEATDKLIAAVAAKNLVVLSGTIGDYVLLFLGSSVDDLVLANNLGESLVTGDSLAFCDAYAAKDLAAVIHGRKDMLDSMMASAGGLADMASGLRDGLAGAEGMGDTRDLESLLRLVGERESALRKMITNEAFCTVAFFEDGLKLESCGGLDKGMIDWKAPHRLTALGDSPDVVLFANLGSRQDYDEKAQAYCEALMETAYAVAMKVAEAEVEDPSLAQFKEMAKMFDSRFRTDLVALWNAFSGDFGSSLGHESALVIDLKGSMPTVPGIPQAVVNEAKFPRISVVSPVTDRAKLAASWEKMNTTATGILAKASEMTGQEIPMQKPLSSEKNGYTTWFFPMPFFNDDFVPSVTVGDQWFAASTSKNQALDLVAKAGTGETQRSGLFVSMNFPALQTFLKETLKVLEKNSGEMPAIDKNQLTAALKYVEAMDELDRLTLHARTEDGQVRTSIHFKTR